jgi:hypothetical protein
MIDYYIFKNSLTEMNNYELFAMIALIRNEICDRHIRNHDGTCQYCPMSSYVCRHLQERLEFLATQEEREVDNGL